MNDLNILEKQIIVDALKFYICLQKNNNSTDNIYRLSTGEIKVINRLINILESENE